LESFLEVAQKMQFIRLFLVVACAAFIDTPPLSANQEIETPPRVDNADASQTAEKTRFEGYLFLDADGHPLPFQSDEEIERWLSNAPVVSISKIPVGVSRPKQVLLSGDAFQAKAIFKYIEEEKKNVRDPTATGRGRYYLTWRDSYVYEAAVYRLDRLLGLNRVPPVVLRTVRGSKGSLQIWLEGTFTENDRRERSIKPPEIARFNQQRSTMHLIDNLVANRDSNLGNTLIDGNWRLWYVDCGRCFGTSQDLLYPQMITHCDREVWRDLKELDRSAADEALSAYLTGAEIDALFVRRDKLVDLLQARIDEWGEDLVLFDQRPHTETAPGVEE
jgi:hypothetical protein